MQKSKHFLIRRRWVIVSMSLTILLLIPFTVFAASPGFEGSIECVNCHVQEADTWSHSAHAVALDSVEDALRTACAGELGSGDCNCLSCHTTGFDQDAGTYDHRGVTCEACHGTYTEGHPQGGTMRLVSDSSMCQDCHSDTHQQWQDSAHGQANVQCIGCHQVHSQDLRLGETSLCESCHSDRPQDGVHTLHVNGGIGCADCHVGSVHANASLDSTVSLATDRPVAASHEFGTPATDTCVDCHAQSTSMHAVADTAVAVERVDELALELHEAEESSRSWQTLSFVTLGMGLGVGGVLGAIFVLGVGIVCQRRGKS